MAEPSTPKSTDLHAKALAINLEASIYGTFAEIGAGQEVARWFLSAGAASGTVAQAISAYDKTVSDDTYGAGTRYVSKERLLAMLDHEYQLLVDRLGKDRGAQTRFFVFADTIATRNYQGTNEQHGWVGIRFQGEPDGQPNHVLLHITLGDPTAALQQQAIGALGVNLIYAAYHQRSSPETFLTGLYEDLSAERIEVDVLDLTGPVFAGMDSRHWSLELLRRGMTHALVFDSKAQIVEPSTPLRKRPLVVQRTLHGHPGLFGGETFQAARQQFVAEGKSFEHEPAVVIELTIGDPGESRAPDNAELLSRIEQLAALGAVVVTDFPEGYRVIDYLRRHTAEPIRIILAISGLLKIMEETLYAASPGALLEIFGRLLATDVTVYVAPMRMEPFVAALGGLPEGFVQESAASEFMTLDDFIPKPPIDHLLEYLRGAGRVVPLGIPAKT
ncbi:MAG TPA: hypothetical protein VJX29_01005 [Candidatus Acidoferrales bacterium]|nr:hypothetical protein [Candidatus Acidoferrales bacterium]